MNQMPRIGLLVSLVSVLAGCPIYGGSGGGNYCDNNYDDCSNSDSSGSNNNGTCSQDSDCPSSQYCSPYGTCKTYPSGSSTSSAQGGAGPTTTSTTTSTTTTTTGSSSAQGGAGGTGPTPVYCGHPSDCSAGETCAPDGTCHPGDCSADGCIFGYSCSTATTPPACISTKPNPCDSDANCTNSGDKCVNGSCTAPADQCFDQTQCSPGDVCAAGKCTPSCSTTSPCVDSAFQCSAVDTCTVPATSCNITNDCGSASLVCVDGACVARSPNGTCPSGLVWVENGCVPDQAASFVCATDGTQGLCAGGSVCLHHSCYISCDSPNQTACSGLPSFNQCKAVTTTSGTHDVCGSSSNLGGQCDPTAGIACSAGLVCIDGFCK